MAINAGKKIAGAIKARRARKGKKLQELEAEDFENENFIQYLMDEGYDLEGLEDMTAEEQELFFNKIGDAFKKAGNAIVDTTKKVAPKVVDVAKTAAPHLDKGLSTAATVAGAVAPVAAFVPVVGTAVSAAATGVVAANTAKEAAKAAVNNGLMMMLI